MTNKTTKRAPARFDYDALDIGVQSKKALEAAAAGIQALGRRSTDQAFELGVLLEQASEHVEPGTFENGYRSDATSLRKQPGTTGLLLETSRLIGGEQSSLRSARQSFSISRPRRRRRLRPRWLLPRSMTASASAR
ncbi:hypothetical protein MF410_14975 [Rhizobium sp. C104]|uniref:hypothetical protein n=1 Tax=Rhizobium sp. C104 TaxID=2917727 RepID=UPI001EF79D88|nr:hypothetical protein [Rhizobium sp. C104]ULJ77350.1 hypothetical protein MF410_14975 [Rhizobium sp. C104]